MREGYIKYFIPFLKKKKKIHTQKLIWITPLFTSFATLETTHYHYFQEITKLANSYYLIYSISLPYPLTIIFWLFSLLIPGKKYSSTILICNEFFFQCLLLTFSTFMCYRLCAFVTFKVIICSWAFFYFSYKIINKVFYYHLL